MLHFRLLQCILLSVIGPLLLAQESNNPELDSLRNLLSNEEDLSSRYELLDQIEKEQERTDRSLTISTLREMIGIAKELKDASRLNDSYRVLGANFLYLSQNDSSLHYLQKAFEYYQEESDTIAQTRVLNNIGLIFQRTNDYEKAIEKYNQVVNYSKKTNDYVTELGTHINLASLQINLENPALAIPHLQAAEERYLEVPTDSTTVLQEIKEFLLPGMYINLGLSYAHLEKQDSALYYYNKSLEAIKEIPNEYNATYLRSYTNNNLGGIYHDRGEWNKAIESYNISLDGFNSIQNPQGAVIAQTGIGGALTKIGQNRSAKKILLEALARAKKYDIKEEIRDSYEYLAVNAKALGNYKASIGYYENYTLYKDSLLNKDRIDALQKYETEAKEAEIKILTTENKLADQEKKQQRNIFLVSLLGLIGLSLLGYSRYRLAKQREVAQYERSLSVAMARFVPTAFIKTLGRDKIQDVRLGDQVEQDITVVFTDIRDFTSRSEKMSAVEAFNFIRNYAEAMGPIIREHGGFINQYLGDGLMIVFKDEVLSALNACKQMHERIREYNEDLKSKGIEPIVVGMGVHHGPAIMGIIGDEQRLDAAMISDTINTAARIEGLTKKYGVEIMISDEARSSIDSLDENLVRHLGNVKVKGKDNVLSLYEWMDGYDSAKDQSIWAPRDEFEEAVNCYDQHSYKKALELFEHLHERYPQDQTVQSFINILESELDSSPA